MHFGFARTNVSVSCCFLSHAFHLKLRDKQTTDSSFFLFVQFFRVTLNFQLVLEQLTRKRSNVNGMERKIKQINKMQGIVTNAPNWTRFSRWIYDHCWSAKKAWCWYVTIKLSTYNIYLNSCDRRCREEKNIWEDKT